MNVYLPQKKKQKKIEVAVFQLSELHLLQIAQSNLQRSGCEANARHGEQGGDTTPPFVFHEEQRIAQAENDGIFSGTVGWGGRKGLIQ